MSETQSKSNAKTPTSATATRHHQDWLASLEFATAERARAEGKRSKALAIEMQADILRARARALREVAETLEKHHKVQPVLTANHREFVASCKESGCTIERNDADESEIRAPKGYRFMHGSHWIRQEYGLKSQRYAFFLREIHDGFEKCPDDCECKDAGFDG